MGIVYNTSIVRDQLHVLLDFANIKSYPGTGLTVNNLSQLGNFAFNKATSVANGVAIFDGLNPGNTMSSPSSLGIHGTESFSYQFLINPKSSSSIDSPGEARVCEQLGWPNTFFILQILHNSGNPFYRFFGKALNSESDQISVNTPAGAAILNSWQLVTIVLDRATTNTAILYINNTKYSASVTSALGSVGNGNPLRIPSSYAEAEVDISCVLGYRKALSDAEVAQNFEALRGRFGL